MVVIIFTGVPGTGKTTLAKALAKDLKYKYLDVNKLIEEKKLIDDYDELLDTKIVDTDKLVDALAELIRNSKTDLIIDSHLAYYIPKKYVDYCIVCTCDLKILKKRLLERNYNPQKVRDNLDAEIFNSCLVDALEFGHNVVQIDTSNDRIDNSLTKIKQFLGKKSKAL